jgi:phage gp36-like protein
MAYCTQNDLLQLIPVAELAELTTEAGDTPDPNVVAEAISKADAEIDAYLATRYQVPFNPAPGVVRALSVDLALYHLYSRRSVAPQVRRQKYQDAVAFLKQAAAGQAAVAGAEGEALSHVREVADLRSATRVFSRDFLTEW